MLQATGLGYTHPNGAKPVFSEITLALPPGSRTLITGANGAGKSTLGLILAGLLRADDPGCVQWEGAPLAILPQVQRVAQIQIVGQRADLHLSGRADNVQAEVAFGLENLGFPRAEIARRAALALQDMGLSHLSTANPRRLSGGETQRLAIAGALAMRPGLLILDEPLTDLDQAARAGLIRRLGAQGSDGAVLVLDLSAGAWPAGFFTAIHQIGDGGLREGAAPDAPGARRLAAPVGPDLLRVQDLAFARGDRPLLRDLSFAVPQGACMAITGPNGAGKSTLLRLIAGLERPDAGQIALCGLDPATAPARQVAGVLGMVMQNADRQFTAASLLAEATLAPRLQGQPAPQTAALAALDALGLADQAATHPFDLHNGARRLAAVAAALSHAPRLLVLDETQRGLDAAHLARLEACMAAHCARGGAVLFVSHDADFTDRNASHRLHLAAAP